MTKRIKTLVAMGLAAVMLISCGAPANESSATSESKAVESSTAGVQESSTAQETEPKYPEYLNLESARPVVKDGEDITLKVAVYRASVAEKPVEDTWFYHFVEEKLNIDLEVEWLTSENKDERLGLMLAANDLPDLLIGVALKPDQISKYVVEEGMFLPLSDWYSEELTPNMLAYNERYKDYLAYYTAPDGKIYTIPAVKDGAGKEGYDMVLYKTFIDTRYMEAAGINEMPDTLDGFVDMLRAFKALDPATMGVEEIYPMLKGVGELDAAYLTNAFGWITTDYADLTVPCWDVQKGEMVVPCLEEKYADYITFFNTLYTEGLLHPDFFTLDKATIRAIAASGQAAVTHDYAPYLFDWDGFANYPLARPLKSEYNPEGMATLTAQYMDGQIYVSAETEYPEVCMRFLDYICSPEGCVYWGIGCPEGSEDTLGMITGYKITEDMKTYTYDELEAGQYEGNVFNYTQNEISISQNQCISIDATEYYKYEIAGVKHPQLKVEFDVAEQGGWLNQQMSTVAAGKMLQGAPALFVDSDKTERYTDLKTVLKNYIEAESAKFIVGQRALSDLPKFLEELKVIGGDEYKEIVLSSFASYEGPGEAH